MRFRRLSKWDDPTKCPGLVYFAQIVEEMLFDFSLDTYKASVMHTGLLCTEALQTIDEIESGNIKLPNLWHVTSELCSCYEKDPVAKSLIPLSSSGFVPTLKNKKGALKEVRTVVELLSVQLSARNYKIRNEELLIQEVGSSRSLSEIRRLARSYVTTLIAIGFHPKYIHDTCLEFFYYGSNRIGGWESIKDFFAVFAADKSEFDVIFRVGKIFEGVSDVFSDMNLMITRTLPSGMDLSNYPAFNQLGVDELYAIAHKVQAREIFSARNSAESLLKLVSTLISLYHHKENPTWPSECIVHNSANGTYRKIAKPTNSMQKCADLVQSVASNRIKLLLDEFSLDQDSFLKFIRSAQLHSMALSSNTDENQILNLWIALESLVPSETKSDDACNIEHIVNSLIPFLNIGYLERLLNNLVKDLLRWNGHATRNALRKIGGRKFIDRLVKGLILPEFAPDLAPLEAQFRDFHLLRDRFDHFRHILSSPANVVSALDAHRVRLEWQIRRIYRVRNVIVHSGRTPAYTNSLIEHTHSYLDVVLATLVKLASKPKSIHSVAQGFKYVELQYNDYYRALSEKGLVFNRDNIDTLLFSRP